MKSNRKIALVQQPKPKDLGPKQIEWLKANVPQFGPAKDAADRVKAHEAETAKKIEGLR